MTLDEKVQVVVEQTPSTGCSGQTYPVERLNWPGLCFNDAENGVRDTELVTGWPSGLHVGASWNRTLAYYRARQMGGEFRRKGVNVALSPVAGPLGRMAEGGRNWEGFSNDPYLSGQVVAETVQGIQDAGVIASVKHFIANEQETNRAPIGSVSAVSSNLDDTTIHELYLWPFVDAVHAGAGSVMCSYNRVNNSFSCQNSKILNGLLKSELGFQGFVVSDWNAQHSGVASAAAGLDVAMPTSSYWGVSGEILATAVKNGSLDESRVTDMATRVTSSWFQLGQNDGFPPEGIDYTIAHNLVDARNPGWKQVLLDGAIEGHVLVKNTNSALPLKSPKLLSLFGCDCPAPRKMKVPSPADFGISGWAFGYESSNVTQAFLEFLSGTDNKLILEQPEVDNTGLFWDFDSVTPTIDAASSACLVFINAFSAEGFDRVGLHDDYSDALVQNVASNCNNTIVIIHNAGIRLVDQWVDHPNVTAVMFAHLPGQDSGRALVQLLYGFQSPSGKLPYTVAKNESDYNVLTPALPEGIYSIFPQSNFTEGTAIDYRYFEAKGIVPRYGFGFGASTAYYPPNSTVLPGGVASLWDVIATAKATVKNTGEMGASEVSQLYVVLPGETVKQLRGFTKTFINPGESEQISFSLTRRDLSRWSTVDQSWVLQPGTYEVNGSTHKLSQLTKAPRLKDMSEAQGEVRTPNLISRPSRQESPSTAPDRQSPKELSNAGSNMTASLQRSHLSQDEETLFTSHLVSSFFTEAVDSNSSPQVSPWVVFAMQHSSLNCASRLALHALAAAYFGKVHHHQRALRKGALLYVNALRELRGALLHTPHALDATTLTMTLFLAMYESVTFNDPAAWIRIGRLIEARGPYRHQTGLEKEIFRMTRSVIALGHLVERKRCFLEQDVWKTLPWALSPGTKSVMDYLLDILCDVPGILEDADLLQQNSGGAPELRRMWERQFSNAHFLVEIEQLGNVGVGKMEHCPFSTAVFFNEPIRVNELCVYDALLLILFRVGDSLGLPFTSPPYGSLQQPDCCLPNPSTGLLLPGQGTVRDIAREICRMVPYTLLSYRGNAGAVMLAFPLQVAYRSVDENSAEAAWLDHVISHIADVRGFGAVKYMWKRMMASTWDTSHSTYAIQASHA
ncbi:hypothetical protein VTN77DRAFT_1634 [Rasamsonia byssochlamydoides]|uniref:uncharacterized protein n=1 Tax=Rasamsonia byssochlamydoides TaxID=89139 RepID=UPI003742963A